MRPAFAAGTLALATTACSPGTPLQPVSSAFSPPDTARCSGAGIAIDTEFPAGALDSCSIDESGRVTISIAPEDAPPINCSPWYAFRIHTDSSRDVTVHLTYTACGHRYKPKTSADGETWTYLEDEAVRIGEFAGRTDATLTVETGSRPIFVSAQEIVAPATYDAWLDGIESHPSLSRRLLGQSAQGRAIEVIRIGNPDAREQVLLVGRQHPPEVTGALAMFPFVETILSDRDLARRFRERFRVTAVPLLNPDGVVRGHWRHNTGGVDLNRDWGPFTQPETRLMKGVMDAIAADPSKDLRLLLDFHSTNRDIFYTIPDALPTDPELFTAKWLARYQELMTGYEVVRDARHTVGRPISKAYAFDTYGIPAITFEIGDETDRDLIPRIGRQSAIAMMETLLATPSPPDSGLGGVQYANSIPKRILFVGNSYFYYNDSLHNHVRRIADASGAVALGDLTFKSATIGGAALRDHAIGHLVDPQSHRLDVPFEIVIMQGISSAALSENGRARFFRTANDYAKIVRASGAQPVLYMTPAYAPQHRRYRPSMTDEVASLYIETGAAIDAMVIPVGLAFAEAYRRDPAIVLHNAVDHSHPSLHGTYLAAATTFASLYRVSPVGAPYDYFGRIDPDTARFLQEVARDTVASFYGEELRP